MTLSALLRLAVLVALFLAIHAASAVQAQAQAQAQAQVQVRAVSATQAVSTTGAPSISLAEDSSLTAYRQIGVSVAAQDLEAGMVIELRIDGEPHTTIAVQDIAGLSRPSLAASLQPCLEGSEPIARTVEGLPRIAAGSATIRCGLRGMLPDTDHRVQAVLVDARGHSGDYSGDHREAAILARSAELVLATHVSDVRLLPPDTRPILYILGSLFISLVGLLAGLRWWDIRTGRNPSRNAHIYVAPAIIALTLLTFYPIAYGIWLSFTDAHQTHLGQSNFVGLSNFLAIATSAGLVQVSLFTLFWVVGNVIFHVGLGLALALILNRETLRGRVLYRTILLVPWTVPAYISVLAWQGMLQPEGLLNLILGAQANYLGAANAARLSVTMVNIWLGVPFMMMSLAGALKSIPTDMYEAAAIDGVSPWQQFRHITLPNIKNALVPLSLLGFIWTFNSFNTIYLLTRGGPYLGFGEPGATDIMVTYIFDLAFEYGDYGLAAAWSVFVFLLLVGFSWVYIRQTRATEAVT